MLLLLPLSCLLVAQDRVGGQFREDRGDQQAGDVRCHRSAHGEGIPDGLRVGKGLLEAQWAETPRAVAGDRFLEYHPEGRVGRVGEGGHVPNPGQPERQVLGEEPAQEHQKQDDDRRHRLADLDVVEGRPHQLAHSLSGNHAEQGNEQDENEGGEPEGRDGHPVADEQEDERHEQKDRHVGGRHGAKVCAETIGGRGPFL